jgi:hypothetical protein
MELNNELTAGLFILPGFVLMFSLMAILMVWARRRSRGAIALGAFMSIFAPDPTLERKIKLVEEAKEIQSEEDEKGGE